MFYIYMFYVRSAFSRHNSCKMDVKSNNCEKSIKVQIKWIQISLLKYKILHNSHVRTLILYFNRFHRDTCSWKWQLEKREIGNFWAGKSENRKFSFKLESIYRSWKVYNAVLIQLSKIFQLYSFQFHFELLVFFQLPFPITRIPGSIILETYLFDLSLLKTRLNDTK